MITDDELIGKILGTEFIDSLREWDELIEKRSNEPFTLVIMGEFKRGKSTIINALLGKELAPTNVSPETYTINEISYGRVPGVEAVFENGKRMRLTMRDATRERLEARMKFFPGKIDHLDIKDNSAILKEMRIVDTPGLSDLDDLDRQVTDYIVNADAVMYATSALLPFSESEQVFLGSHIQPQRFGMLYILVNMIDALNGMEDVEKIMDRFEGIAAEIVPNAFVYGISGFDELARKMGAKRPADKGTREFYESQFFKFELSLKRDIMMQKDIIRTKRVISMLRQMLDETSAKLNMFYEMSVLDKQKLNDVADGFEREANSVEAALEEKKPLVHLSIVEMQQQAEQWMYEFFAGLRKSILECLDKDAEGEPVYSAEDIEKFFYPFLMEKVGEAYRTCIEIHREAINGVVEKISLELADKLGIADLSEVMQSTSVDRIMMSMNKNVTRSVMGVKLFGTSETFPPATMTSFSQILKKKKQTTDIIDIALENYDDIRINIVGDIKLVYQDLETKAISQLESICRYQTEVGRKALEQAKEVSASSELKEEEVNKALSTAVSILKEPARILEKYDDR
ncbi:MAG: dynamin family protein [Ruminococcus sp.]|nr:dynamin family protein [Ruminococcus sp.]